MTKVSSTLKKYTMLIALALVMVLFQVLLLSSGRNSLFSPGNITSLINQNAYVVILATGMLLCIIGGGNIDLSVGSVVALVGALAGKLIVEFKLSIGLSILICLIAGIAIGAWQAFWIAYMKIPPFIVTLAGMLTFRGLTLMILNGRTIAPFPATFSKFFTNYIPSSGSGKQMLAMIVAAVICVVYIGIQVFSILNKKKKAHVNTGVTSTIIRTIIVCAIVLLAFWQLGQDKGIPVVLILLAVITLIYGYYTQYTVPGRRLYAMGGNEKAARLSGINTQRIQFFAYTNMGFLSAVAALVCVARFNSASPSAGTSYEMDAIAACYIGGASAYGGVGTVGGAVIGAIFMGVLNNGMSLLGVGDDKTQVIKGLVLLAAVVVDVLTKNKKNS